MGLFSKNNNIDQEDNNDFFDRLKLDLENQERNNPKLEDYSEIKNTYSITPEEVKGDQIKSIKNKADTVSKPLDALIRKIEGGQAVDNKPSSDVDFDDIIMTANSSKAEDDNTLLQKCSAYTKDDDGNDFSIDDEPIYKLKTVAEILKNDGFRALDNLSKKYDIKITDETVPPVLNKIEIEDDENNNNDSNQISNTDKNKNSNESEELVFEDYLNFSSNNVQKDENTVETENQTPDISDIDNVQKINEEETAHVSFEQTVRFTPIKNFIDKTNEIKISNITQTIQIDENIDVSSSSSDFEKKELENTDFDDFIPKEQINSYKDIKTFIIKIAKTVRKDFVFLIISTLLTFIVSVFAISPLLDIIINNKGAFIFCSMIFFVNAIVNYDMFFQFAKIISKNCTADISSAILTVFVVVSSLSQITARDTTYIKSVFYTMVIASIILFVRSLMKFKVNSYILSNIKQLNSKSNKTAVTLINDPSVTYSMAKDCIEGDVLLAGSRKTDFISDYTKHIEYDSIFGGKISVYQGIVFILSLITLFGAYIYYHDFIAAMFCATTVQTFFALPTLFFINNLPISSANKKLKADGAMICGNYGAKLIENANAAVLSTSDIFPDGSIVLKDIKVLADNNIDDMLLRATSLAQSVDSTLAPVFRKIAKSNTDYLIPDSDTVKYEKRLGISGYVDNELLLIGNRKFMESHGIEVPSIEVDKKILHNGFFPVYLSTMQKTCALLIVEYIPSPVIAKQLRKITDAGVTLLFTNSDPNINELMISDHFGLYEDSVKIVSNAGEHMYKNATMPTTDSSAPAMYRFKSNAFLNILNCANFVKKTNVFFSVFSLISSVLLSTAFIYSIFASSGDFPSALLALGLEFGITVISLIYYFIKKP